MFLAQVFCSTKTVRKILELKIKKTNETIDAWNTCSQELHENKKICFQILGLVFTPNNKCNSNLNNLFYIKYIPLLRTKIREFLIFRPTVIIVSINFKYRIMKYYFVIFFFF